MLTQRSQGGRFCKCFDAKLLLSFRGFKCAGVSEPLHIRRRRKKKSYQGNFTLFLWSSEPGPVEAKLVQQETLFFPLKLKSKREHNRWAGWDCAWSFLDTARRISLDGTHSAVTVSSHSPPHTHRHDGRRGAGIVLHAIWDCFPPAKTDCRLTIFLFPHCFASSILTLFLFFFSLSTPEPRLL